MRAAANPLAMRLLAPFAWLLLLASPSLAQGVWTPPPGTTWQWQITGVVDESIEVEMYDIDLFDASAATVASLHHRGRKVV